MRLCQKSFVLVDLTIEETKKKKVNLQSQIAQLENKSRTNVENMYMDSSLETERPTEN